jgi:hypothetical protein
MGATEHPACHLGSMPDDLALAVFTFRRQSLNCALEAVEGVPRTFRDHLKTLVLLIATNFALCHESLLEVFHSSTFK